MTASRAWAALVTAFVMPYLASTVSATKTTLEQFQVIVGGAAISALIVYFVPNKPVTE